MIMWHEVIKYQIVADVTDCKQQQHLNACNSQLKNYSNESNFDR